MQVQKKLLKFSACLGETDTRENERSTALRGLRKDLKKPNARMQKFMQKIARFFAKMRADRFSDRVI